MDGVDGDGYELVVDSVCLCARVCIHFHWLLLLLLLLLLPFCASVSVGLHLSPEYICLCSHLLCLLPFIIFLLCNKSVHQDAEQNAGANMFYSISKSDVIIFVHCAAPCSHGLSFWTRAGSRSPPV